MDFYERLTIEKAQRKLNNKALGAIIGMEGETFRMATNRKSLNQLQIREIEKFFDSKKDSSKKTNESDITGYYLPNVSASAGLENEMQNDELNKIPVTIPGWEKDIVFINVFGDSMYPKFNAGEVIGVKPIEVQYLNYGYPYVVVLTNGDTYIKIVQPGTDKEHLLLVSVNEFYKPKEFHLSLIKSFYSIKGVIKKEMM